MKNTPQELKELFPNSPDAIERMLLVTMLQEALAGSQVAGAALHGVMEHTQPVTENEKLTFYGPEKISIGELKARLSDAESKVEHQNKLLETAGALTASLAAAAKGWRVPKRGDRLRLVKPVGTGIYGHDWIAVGDVVTCKSLGICFDEFIPGSTGISFSGVQFLKPGDDTMVACLPLDCFIPVTETTTKEQNECSSIRH